MAWVACTTTILSLHLWLNGVMQPGMKRRGRRRDLLLNGMEFKDYKIKAKLWLRTTRTPAVARGPLLLKGLSGTPWEHMKFLATDDRWLDDPTNGNFLLSLMDTKEYYGEEERESMLAACSRLTFHLRRSKGERAQSFMLRCCAKSS